MFLSRGLPLFLVFPIHPVPDDLRCSFHTGQFRSYEWLFRSPPPPLSFANWSACSFPSISLCPSIPISCSLLFSASSIRNWRQSQTNLELIYLSSALIAAWLIEYKCSCFYSPYLCSQLHVLWRHIPICLEYGDVLSKKPNDNVKHSTFCDKIMTKPLKKVIFFSVLCSVMKLFLTYQEL
jgi:hypothetical protein